MNLSTISTICIFSWQNSNYPQIIEVCIVVQHLMVGWLFVFGTCPDPFQVYGWILHCSLGCLALLVLQKLKRKENYKVHYYNFQTCLIVFSLTTVKHLLSSYLKTGLAQIQHESGKKIAGKCI